MDAFIKGQSNFGLEKHREATQKSKGKEEAKDEK